MQIGNVFDPSLDLISLVTFHFYTMFSSNGTTLASSPRCLDTRLSGNGTCRVSVASATIRIIWAVVSLARIHSNDTSSSTNASEVIFVTNTAVPFLAQLLAFLLVLSAPESLRPGWVSAATTISLKALDEVGVGLDRGSNTVPTRVIAIATEVPRDCFVIIAPDEEYGIGHFARKSELLELGCFHLDPIEVGIFVAEFK